MNINKQSKVKEGSKKDQEITVDSIVQFLADVDGNKIDATKLVTKSSETIDNIKKAECITNSDGVDIISSISDFTAAVESVKSYTPTGSAAFIKDGVVEAISGKLNRKSVKGYLRKKLDDLGSIMGEIDKEKFKIEGEGKMKKFVEIDEHITKLRETELKWIKQNIAV